jgi:hypothetical protein
MNAQTITFKIARDAEAKKEGDIQEVTLTVNFEGVAEADLIKAALQAQIVGWQSQIRSHWTEFVEGKIPEEITFGDTLFSGTSKKTVTVVRPATQEEMLAAVRAKLQEGKSLKEILGALPTV